MLIFLTSIQIFFLQFVAVYFFSKYTHPLSEQCSFCNLSSFFDLVAVFHDNIATQWAIVCTLKWACWRLGSFVSCLWDMSSLSQEEKGTWSWYLIVPISHLDYSWGRVIRLLIAILSYSVASQTKSWLNFMLVIMHAVELAFGLS